AFQIARSGRLETADRFLERRKEVLLPEMREQPEAFQLVLHRILHFGEAHLDAGGLERLVELANGVRGGDGDAGDGRRWRPEPADRGRRARDRVEHAVAE